MKKFAVLFAVVLLAVSFVSISAQEKAPCASACKSTAIDSETKVKFQKLKLQYELDMVDLNAEKETLHKAMMTELLNEETSKKSIDKIAKSINTNQGKMIKAKMSYLLKVKDVLPADHYKKFLMKSSCHGMKGHGHNGCEPGCKKPCCASKASGCKSKSAGCSKGASKCSSAGLKGHTCTDACKTASAKSAHCETPCSVKVSK